MKKAGLIIIFVVLSVLLLYILAGQITGRLGSDYRSCVDSDADSEHPYGDNNETKGTLVYTVYSLEREYVDYCFSRAGKQPEKWVNEYYCALNEKVKSRDYLCVNGCEDGKCLKKEKKCEDSDNGLAYKVRGKTCDEEGCEEDRCLDETYLSESYCLNGEAERKINKCEKGCDEIREVCK